MTDADLAYYRRRMEQAEHRCAQASAPDIASLHRRMAEGYRAMVEADMIAQPRQRL